MFFKKGDRVTLSANFRWEGTSPTTRKLECIALSRGIEISVVCSFVLSQSTRVMDRRTDRRNYDHYDNANIAASRGKKIRSQASLFYGRGQRGSGFYNKQTNNL